MANQRGRSQRGGEAYSFSYVEPLSAARTKLADIFNSLLFLAGFTCRNVQIKDPPALRAAQSHGVLKHVHLSDRHGPRMLDDAPVEHRHGFVTGRLDRIVRSIHHDGHAGDYLIDRHMVCHPAGAAREDQFVLIFKAFQRDTQRMHGETLLHEGSAVKHLRHDNPLGSIAHMGLAC